jgi:hypothetical protein
LGDVTLKQKTPWISDWHKKQPLYLGLSYEHFCQAWLKLAKVVCVKLELSLFDQFKLKGAKI